MSWVRIWIHLVFSTKNRIPYLNSHSIRKQFFEHIQKNAKEKEIWLDSVNGYQEHIHCLISLGKEQTISKVAQLIKGESSFWINRSDIIKSKFTWQDDYWAVSISDSHAERVRNYIKNQDLHHVERPFAEEIDEFMKKYGWTFIKGEE
jgi:REP element-mobilizing transposase RayT